MDFFEGGVHAPSPDVNEVGRYSDRIYVHERAVKRGTWGGIQGGVRAWLGWAVTSRREAVVDFPTEGVGPHAHCYNRIIRDDAVLRARFGPFER